MPKFKFKSKKKNKFNFVRDKNEILSTEIGGPHIEIYSNKKITLEDCQGIVDYQDNYIKLKLKKGFLTLNGYDFLILSFDDEIIDIKGNITAIEFCL